MSNTTVSEFFQAEIDSIQMNTSLYGYSIIFLFGNIGSILNVLILAQRNYRQNSCSCYFLASTITNFFIMNSTILFRLLSHFNIDPTKTSWFFCKFRAYLTQLLTVLSRTYILLACIDRWAMTSRSAGRRAFARLRVAKIFIPSTMIVWTVFFSIFHSIRTSFKVSCGEIYRSSQGLLFLGRCVLTTASYVSFYNIYNAAISGFSIPISTIIFGLLTIRNVRQLKRRVHNNNIIQYANRMNGRNFEYQLSSMILVQLGVYVVSNLPFVSYLFYVLVTMNPAKSSIQTEIDNLYMTFAYLFANVNFAGTFYLYTLTSSVFRKDLKELLFRNRLMTILSNTQTVAPRNTQ